MLVVVASAVPGRAACLWLLPVLVALVLGVRGPVALVQVAAVRWPVEESRARAPARARAREERAPLAAVGLQLAAAAAVGPFRS